MICGTSGTAGGDGEAALVEIERTLALIEVRLGPPTAWRLRQLELAIELYRFAQYDLAETQARRAQAALAEIAPAECDWPCPLSIGALRHEIRKLRNARTARPARRRVAQAA